jgi:hypothetical protein
LKSSAEAEKVPIQIIIMVFMMTKKGMLWPKNGSRAVA